MSAKRIVRSAAATWLETLKDYDRSLRTATRAEDIVSLSSEIDAHMAAMPREASVYGFCFPYNGPCTVHPAHATTA